MKRPVRPQSPERRMDEGPNAAAVRAFIACVSRLTYREGAALRRAYLEHATTAGLGGPAASDRAAVIVRVIRAAVEAGLMDAHRRALLECQAAFGSSGAGETGIAIQVGDLAGAIAVRDRVTGPDFEYLAAGWRVAMGDACLSVSVPTSIS